MSALATLSSAYEGFTPETDFTLANGNCFYQDAGSSTNFYGYFGTNEVAYTYNAANEFPYKFVVVSAQGDQCTQAMFSNFMLTNDASDTIPEQILSAVYTARLSDSCDSAEQTDNSITWATEVSVDIYNAADEENGKNAMCTYDLTLDNQAGSADFSVTFDVKDTAIVTAVSVFAVAVLTYL